MVFGKCRPWEIHARKFRRCKLCEKIAAIDQYPGQRPENLRSGGAYISLTPFTPRSPFEYPACSPKCPTNMVCPRRGNTSSRVPPPTRGPNHAPGPRDSLDGPSFETCFPPPAVVEPWPEPSGPVTKRVRRVPLGSPPVALPKRCNPGWTPAGRPSMHDGWEVRVSPETFAAELERGANGERPPASRTIPKKPLLPEFS